MQCFRQTGGHFSGRVEADDSGTGGSILFRIRFTLLRNEGIRRGRNPQKSIEAHKTNTLGDIQLRKAGAPGEGKPPDPLQSLRKKDTPQGAATEKGMVSNGFYLRWNDDLLKTGTIFKGIVPNVRKFLRENHSFDGFQ